MRLCPFFSALGPALYTSFECRVESGSKFVYSLASWLLFLVSRFHYVQSPRACTLSCSCQQTLKPMYTSQPVYFPRLGVQNSRGRAVENNVSYSWERLHASRKLVHLGVRTMHTISLFEARIRGSHYLRCLARGLPLEAGSCAGIECIDTMAGCQSRAQHLCSSPRRFQGLGTGVNDWGRSFCTQMCVP